jgi:hypothetical protein
MSDRITIRLGSLSAPLARYCKKHKLPQAEVIRLALANVLGKKAPTMVNGNPNFLKQKGKKKC